jgi:hypothetical protein
MASVISIIAYGTPAAAQPAVVPSGAEPVQPVHAVQPTPPVQAVAPGGNPPPQPGRPLPGQEQGPLPQLIQLTAAVEGINRFLRDSQRQMVFQVDIKGGHESLTIVNPATGEIIRQIPSSQVLAAAANLQQAGILLPGLFLNETA